MKKFAHIIKPEAGITIDIAITTEMYDAPPSRQGRDWDSGCTTVGIRLFGIIDKFAIVAYITSPERIALVNGQYPY